MVYFDSLGITPEDNLDQLLSDLPLKDTRRILCGYNTTYICRQIGDAEIITNLHVDKYGGFEARGGSTHVRGGHSYDMRVEDRISGIDDSESIYVCSSLTGRGATIAVNTVCGDMQPPFASGDTISFQGVGFLYQSFDLCLSKSKAERLFAAKGCMPDDGQILSGVVQESLFNLVFAKVRSFQTLSFLERRPLYSIEIDSDIGPLTLVVPPAYLEKHRGIHKALENGKSVYVIGMFYLSGSFRTCLDKAPVDEESLLRLLRMSLLDDEYDRLNKYIANDCILKGFVIDGSPVDVLSASFKNLRKLQLATVTKLIVPEKADTHPGKKVLIAELSSYSALLFITAEFGKIKSITITKENIYQFRLETVRESAAEINRRTEFYYSESASGWQNLLNIWLSGDMSASLKFFFGLAPDAVCSIKGEVFEGHNECYTAIHDYVDKNGQSTLCKENVMIRVSIRGTIKLISIF